MFKDLTVRDPPTMFIHPTQTLTTRTRDGKSRSSHQSLNGYLGLFLALVLTVLKGLYR